MTEDERLRLRAELQNHVQRFFLSVEDAVLAQFRAIRCRVDRAIIELCRPEGDTAIWPVGQKVGQDGNG